MIGSVVTLGLKLEVATRRDGSTWIAQCLPLDILSQGRTKKESLSALKEAVETWFESCLERGVLEQALEEAGFVPPTSANLVALPKKLAKPAPHYINVTVPAYIAAQQPRPRAAC